LISPRDGVLARHNGKMTDLGSLGGACGYVAAMNDSGQVDPLP
jgi:hypothetical protein